MNLATMTQDQLLQRCGWCHVELHREQPRFGSGVKLPVRVRPVLEPFEGRFLPFPVNNEREIILYVTRSDSPARAQGFELSFQGCSEKCLRELLEAFSRKRKEWEGGGVGVIG